MEELFIKLNRFNNILFKEEGHTYYRDNKEVISCTSLIKKYQIPFDENYWATYKALEANGHKIKIWQFKYPEVDYTPLLKKVSVEDIKEQWNKKKEIGLRVGTAIHNFLENLWGRKILDTDVSDEKYKVIKKQAINFYNDFKDRYIPVVMECVVGNELVCGQIDGLFYDIKLKGLVIIDYKTDKKIEYTNKYQKFLPPLDHLQDCNFNKYSIQTSSYKLMFEDATELPIVDIKIIWFTDTNENYEIITPNIYEKEIRDIWQQYQQSLVD